MPYFPDLSPYSFLTPKDQVRPTLLNVGWLSREHAFVKGAVDQSLVEKLLGLCRTRVRLTRGFHRCEFCGVFPMFMTLNGEEISLGNGEIRVAGADGKTYAAPTMICHYIGKHEYRPPQEFLDAVAALPASGFGNPMLMTYFRRADDRDLGALTQGRGSLRRNLLTVALPIASLTAGIAYRVARSWWIAGFAGTVLFAASAYSNLIFFRKAKRRESMKADVKAVQVYEVSADRVLDVEPLGDNGPALCFFVGGGKALLLVGQWLLNHDSFPAKSFRLHVWVASQKAIRMESMGAAVEAEHSNVRLRPEHRVRQVQVIDARPETLQVDLDRALTGN